MEIKEIAEAEHGFVSVCTKKLESHSSGFPKVFNVKIV